MAAAASVHYANEEQHHILRLVSTYAEALQIVQIESSNELSLRNSEGNLHLTGLNTICRYIAELGSKREQLLGLDIASKAQVRIHRSRRGVFGVLLKYY